jgi:hypothetical protein
MKENKSLAKQLLEELENPSIKFNMIMGKIEKIREEHPISNPDQVLKSMIEDLLKWK